MTPARRAVLVALLAVLGIVLAAAITWGTSQLVRQHIGLSSEPLTAGRSLLPPVASRRSRPSSTRGGPPSTTSTARTTTSPSRSTAAPAITTTSTTTSPPATATPQLEPQASGGEPAAPSGGRSSGERSSGEGGDARAHGDD